MAPRQKQASTYLDLENYESITALARRRGRSLSEHLRTLVEQDILTGGVQSEALTSHLASLNIGMDALLRNHPNTKLFELVKAVREAHAAGTRYEA